MCSQSQGHWFAGGASSNNDFAHAVKAGVYANAIARMERICAHTHAHTDILTQLLRAVEPGGCVCSSKFACQAM
jgi:hypothetical protein